jgi:hypothetical protein
MSMSKLVKPFLAGVLVLFALSACKTASDVGSGPLNMSRSVKASFDKYIKSGRGMYFAVSENGRSSHFFYCPTGPSCIDSTTRAQVIAYCESHSSGVPCKIYARQNHVLWNFGASGKPTSTSGKRPFEYLSNVEVCDQAVDVIRDVVTWKAHQSTSRTEADYRDLTLEKCGKILKKG